MGRSFHSTNSSGCIDWIGLVAYRDLARDNSQLSVALEKHQSMPSFLLTKYEDERTDRWMIVSIFLPTSAGQYSGNLEFQLRLARDYSRLQMDPSFSRLDWVFG